MSSKGGCPRRRAPDRASRSSAFHETGAGTWALTHSILKTLEFEKVLAMEAMAIPVQVTPLTGRLRRTAPGCYIYETHLHLNQCRARAETTTRLEFRDGTGDAQDGLILVVRAMIRPSSVVIIKARRPLRYL